MIEEKVGDFKKEYCPDANILFEYPTSNSITEAQVDLKCMKDKGNEFILRIFPSFDNIDSEEKKDFILRHELMHIKDARNLAFKYDYDFLHIIINNVPEFESSLSKVIWDLSIDMRLEREGFDKVLEYEERIEDFKRGFLNKHWAEYVKEFKFDVDKVKNMVHEGEVTLDKIKDIAKKAKETFVNEVVNREFLENSEI